LINYYLLLHYPVTCITIGSLPDSTHQQWKPQQLGLKSNMNIYTLDMPTVHAKNPCQCATYARRFSSGTSGERLPTGTG